MAEFVRKNCKIEKVIIERNGFTPNNPEYPLIVYRKVFTGSGMRLAKFIESVITGNKWPNMWRSSIYKFHHYHSKTFEFVGCYKGHAKIQLGGNNGLIVDIKTGDAAIIPPGVAHKQLYAAGDFILVGGYPYGEYPDMMYGKENELKQALENIKNVFISEFDPVFGEKFRKLLEKSDAKIYKFKNNEES